MRDGSRNGGSSGDGPGGPAPDHAPSGDGTLRESLELAWSAGWDLSRIEREYILTVLGAVDGQKAAAAEALGISLRTLYRKLKAYRIRGVA